MSTKGIKRTVLPGFGLTMGYTLLYLSLVVLIPLAALFLKSAGLTWEEFLKATTNKRVVASYWLTLRTSVIAATVNAVFGFVVAWTLVRYRFPGRRFIDALVDLPFALPTAVSGIALATVYGPHGWFGPYLEAVGIKVAFAPLGIIVALVFIGLPFIVRTLEPALADLERESEEAAASLGANRWQTFWRVIVPTVMPALLTGFALSLARAIGEYGSVVFIAGNYPMRTEITPLLIMEKLGENNVAGATAVAVVMLVASFVLLLAINVVQHVTGRRLQGAL
jgi:sulfate/thiosulfate transport system permease protein